ncbi:hypothetical protein GY45DRAFT_1435693 [Cubamyces sp. BRFM 1775]|nr:hypothetical protein GY45DRAFT_1435693 [Cubamyces sp. BRFM 1775]
MSHSALELYEPEVHGHYEDWSMDTESDGGEGFDYDNDTMRVHPDDGQVYMMKIPTHLMERWTAIDEDDVLLATIRFYHDPRAASASSSSSSPAAATSTRGPAQLQPRIIMTLPPDSDDSTLGPDQYEMEIHTAEPGEPYNQYIVAEYDSRLRHGSNGSEADPSRSTAQPWATSGASTPARSAAGSRGGARGKPSHKHKISGNSKGAGKKGASMATASARRRRVRRIALAGAVTHRGSLRAVPGERLRQRVKARTVAANTRTRQTIFVEAPHAPRFAIGGSRAAKKPFIQSSKTKAAKGPADKKVRIPRPNLLDMLFTLFEEKLHWPLKMLRERTQQPEAYLKEVLSEIAYPHRDGKHRGTWELSASYRHRKQPGANVVEQPTALEPVELFTEDEDDDAENEDDVDEDDKDDGEDDEDDMNDLEAVI